MKKTILKTLITAAVLTGGAATLASCAGTPESATFTGYRMDKEAGFDELLFPVCQDLVLTGESYTYSETTLLSHKLANNIVATHMFKFKGTFTVTSENKEEGTKTIELSKPTWIIDSNTGTTLADDPELMSKFVINTTVTLNTTNYTATFTLA